MTDIFGQPIYIACSVWYPCIIMLLVNIFVFYLLFLLRGPCGLFTGHVQWYTLINLIDLL